LVYHQNHKSLSQGVVVSIANVVCDSIPDEDTLPHVSVAHPLVSDQRTSEIPQVRNTCEHGVWNHIEGCNCAWMP
jgi:hypothetical protein